MEANARYVSQPGFKSTSEKQAGIGKITKRRKKRRKRFGSLDDMDSIVGDLEVNEDIEIADVCEKKRKVSTLSHIQLPGLIYPRSAYRCAEVPPLHIHHEEQILREVTVCEGASW